MKMQAGKRPETEIRVLATHILLSSASNLPSSASSTLPKQFADFWSDQNAKGCGWEARNQIVASVAPNLFGMYIVKLAMILTLIGGVARVDEGGTRVRGESHLLVVGDHGTYFFLFFFFFC
jgi:DNA helicase MCM9